MPKLFYIAGHGHGDPGAVGNGFQEAERVRALGWKLKELGGDNVLLSDFNRDYYADKGISTMNLSKDYCILEGHMDAGQASARGGHVIIKTGFNPDKYDTALANMLSNILPGRSNLIVGRNNLANVNRAASRGFNYRLVEFGFITNVEDVKIFNSRMSEIAEGVLKAFGIPVKGEEKKSEENKEEEEDMKEIVQAKNGKAQYYFDGYTLHPLASGEERRVISDMYKRHTGKNLQTHIYSDADFDKLLKAISREVK